MIFCFKLKTIRKRPKTTKAAIPADTVKISIFADTAFWVTSFTCSARICKSGSAIEITKPKRFKAGAYSTVALVKNAFTTNIDGKLDLDNFLKVLTNTEELVAATALKC